MSKSLIHIGTIVGTMGIEGLLKVKTFLTNPKKIGNFKNIIIESTTKKINLNFIREKSGNAIVSLNIINNREEGKKLINKKIYIKKTQLPSLKKNEYYLHSLIGFIIETKKQKLGVVKNISNFGAGELIEIKQTNNKTFFLPLNKQNIIEIDLKNKKIKANPLKGIIPNK